MQKNVTRSIEQRRQQEAYLASWAKVSLVQGTHPHNFICPITRNVMDDPVVAGDGYTYERGAITRWLRDNGTSPVTREALDCRLLLPNRELYDSIRDYWVAMDAEWITASKRLEERGHGTAAGLPSNDSGVCLRRLTSDDSTPPTPPEFAPDAVQLFGDYEAL